MPDNPTLSVRMRLAVAPASEFADEVAALEAEHGRLRAALEQVRPLIVRPVNRQQGWCSKCGGLLVDGKESHLLSCPAIIIDAALSATPASDTARKAASVDDALDDALRRIYAKYGPNLHAFFEDVKRLEAVERAKGRG